MFCDEILRDGVSDDHETKQERKNVSKIFKRSQYFAELLFCLHDSICSHAAASQGNS